MEHRARHLVVMGVAGAGKSTVGQALATRLGLPYADGDDLHPAANVAKMSAGHPLDDVDRRPWLVAVGGWLAAHEQGGVVSCSALRWTYRETLRQYAGPIRFVHLTGPPALVAERVSTRLGHFMPPSLVASQYAALEPLGTDEDGIAIPLDWPLDQIVDHATTQLATSVA